MSEKVSERLPKAVLHPTLVQRTTSHAADSVPFLKVWCPSVLVFVSIGLATFGLNWWLALSPGGPRLLGTVVGVANIVAVVVVVVFSGLIDRMDRQRFLLRTMGILTLILALLASVFFIEDYLALLLVLAALCYLTIESVYSTYDAAIETTVADLAPTRWASSRVATLLRIPPLTARLVAPIVGGLMIAWGWLWSLPVIGIAFVALAAIFLVRWSSVLRVLKYAAGTGDSTPANPRAMLQTSLQDVGAAWLWIREKPLLVYIIVVGVLGNLIIFPFYSLLPAFLAELNLDEEVTALLYGRAAGAYGAGLLVATLLFSRFGKKVYHPDTWITLNMLAIVAVFGIISSIPEPGVIVLSMGAIGALFIGLVAIAGGTWLDLTPPEMRARIFSVRRLIMFTSIPIGTSSMGFAGAAFGFVPLLRVLLVIVMVVLGMSWLFLWHKKRQSL
jgi:MFS family permease